MNKVIKTNIADMSAVELTELFKRKALSPVEAVQASFDRISQCNSIVNAYCYLAEEEALKVARESEIRWYKGKPLSLIDGVPSSIKDLTSVSGWPNRNGSLTTNDTPMTYDAPFTKNMLSAGAVILGKTTTPEFGWKGVTDSKLTGITRNPWDTSKTSGGSSGGAAVAAALNMGVLHQSSDAGGSIRIPASFCGVFGIKPTFGFIPQWPASAMTTLSHLGPMTRTVQDSILMMDVITQPDSRDWYSTRIYKDHKDKYSPKPLKGLRVAYSPTLGYVDVDPKVYSLVDSTVKKLEEMGAVVQLIDPPFQDPIDTFSTLWFSGAAKVISNFSAQQCELLDPGFLAIGNEGSKIPIVEYMKATDRRAELGAIMQNFHTDYDILITPTMPRTAFDAGKNTENNQQKHWMEWTPFSYPFNLTQQPALSVPCGQVDGLPVGLQIIADRGNDLLAMEVAKYIELISPSQFLSLPVER
ncbi:amidase [Marinomonas sp. A79]|uniref:Amidase n=1 Tax=Marinomonas vulgaris TaxID=2823372 RepID=A0ABS5HGZ1_9GAMM|nr:amidase [Marinomonas vulgaris]MBR7890169.1 amidase [Marinomonas vulgaris]